jgi:hypothetical protein
LLTKWFSARVLCVCACVCVCVCACMQRVASVGGGGGGGCYLFVLFCLHSILSCCVVDSNGGNVGEIRTRRDMFSNTSYCMTYSGIIGPGTASPDVLGAPCARWHCRVVITEPVRRELFSASPSRAPAGSKEVPPRSLIKGVSLTAIRTTYRRHPCCQLSRVGN